MVKCIAYNGGYKYQLKGEYTVSISIKPPAAIHAEYILLETTGELTIKKGYAWDGPSGPTFDTLTFMRGSLIHDALYQLMREGHLDHKVYRKAADQTLRDRCARSELGGYTRLFAAARIPLPIRRTTIPLPMPLRAVSIWNEWGDEHKKLSI